MNAPSLSDLIFAGIPYKLKLLDGKFVASFVSEVLQMFAVIHFLNLSTAINICISPITFYLKISGEIDLYFLSGFR